MKTIFRIYGIVSIALLLLLCNVIIVSAAPCIDEPGKITLFIARDVFNAGTVDDHVIGKYDDIDFGLSIPIKRVNIGFSTRIDRDDHYTFYELFVNGKFRGDLLFDATYDRLNDDGNLVRFGVFKELPFNRDSFKMYFGPGVSYIFYKVKDADDDSLFNFDEYDNSFSLFFEAKATFKIVDSFAAFANVLYDFNYDAANYQMGVAFSY